MMQTTDRSRHWIPMFRGQHRSLEHTQADNQDTQRASPHRWNWQDALYLLLLLCLVLLMASHYTPNLTGEVAGEWWDPLLNIWTLSWNTTTLLHHPAQLWQGQLLYPNQLTLSYSENLLGETLFFAPILLISQNPVLAYNCVFYVLFFLCGLNMYLLARYHTGNPLAAFVAGLIFAFSPYRLSQIDHLHIIAGAWMPAAFFSLELACKHNRWRYWILFALFYLLQLLSSIYYGIFLSYALCAFVLFRYGRSFFSAWRTQGLAYSKVLLKQGVRAFTVLATTLLIIAILMAPYILSFSHGMSRSLAQTATFSAYLRDFLFTAPFNWLYGVTVYNGVSLPYDSEHYLFLGWVTLIIAAVGIVITWRKPQVKAYLWTGAVIVLGSFGPFFQFSTPSGAPFIPVPYVSTPIDQPGWPMPWLLAYYLLPGFKGLRVPARLIGVLLVIIALLAAYAIASIQNYLHRRYVCRPENKQRQIFANFSSPVYWKMVGVWAVMLIIPLAVLLEGIPASLPVTHVPTGTQIPKVYQWLATHQTNEPIIELPMAYQDQGFTSKDEAWYDYYAIYHGHPLVNGWSGYRPPITETIAAAMQDIPSAASINMFHTYHIHYIVLHLQYYQTGRAEILTRKMSASKDIQRIATFGNDVIWQVR